MFLQVELNPNERIEDFSQFGLRVIQDPKRFCFGIDAVLLADFAKLRKRDKVCDLGTGTGIIPMLMCAKAAPVCPPAGEKQFPVGEATSREKNLSKGEFQFFALEIQSESADMARRSVTLNNLESRIEIITGDIKNACKLLPKNTFDVVTSNPPYMIYEHGVQNSTDEKTIARHEVLCNLEDVVKSASGLLKSNGKFFMIHRPFRLTEIFATLTKYKLEPKRLRFVFPYIDKEPTMVLIESEKCGGAGVRIESPLVVYKEKGVYTDEVNKIYGKTTS